MSGPPMAGSCSTAPTSQRHYTEFRGQIGYVPQEDIIHRDLTVGEALRFTARLRLPADYGDAEIRRRVRDVLDQLDLAGAEDVLIGSAGGSGISGGQRKRVNLAHGASHRPADPPARRADLRALVRGYTAGPEGPAETRRPRQDDPA